MILYRKGAPLRMRRFAAPEPPFWAATWIAPYLGRRAVPIAIDYAALRASGAERLEVTVCDDVRDELERARTIAQPAVIDATETAEPVFRRGEDALAAAGSGTLLVSTRGALPTGIPDDAVLAVIAWPLELARLAALFAEARERRLHWGVAVPVLYPMSTDLAALAALADLAHGAVFLAALPVDVEPTAKQSIAQTMHLRDDDDRYAMLFHGDASPLQLATERHVAALAAERELADFIVPPRWEERSNWNAAVLLTLAAARMMAMDFELDRAGLLARSARVIAALDKPIAHVAEAASLSIIDGVDDVSADALTAWLSGSGPSFVDDVHARWRLRRAIA